MHKDLKGKRQFEDQVGEKNEGIGVLVLLLVKDWRQDAYHVDVRFAE